MDYQVLLYYKYIPVANPEDLRISQRFLCESLQLTGRIIVATEGINGTIGGTIESTEKYIENMRSDPRFADVHFKKSKGISDTFPRLSIKVRSEIVSTHITSVVLDPHTATARHLAPEMLNTWYREGKKFKVIDMRNTYELEVGKFKNSLDPETTNFRDLPQSLQKLKVYKDETIVAVCTGGVRCEKASQYLKTQGFKDVYQLDGGIVTYMEKYPGQDFEGTLYTFDKRKTLDFCAPGQKKVIGKCLHCEVSTETIVDCADDMCHSQITCCENCVNKYEGIVYCKKCNNANGVPLPEGRYMTRIIL